MKKRTIKKRKQKGGDCCRFERQGNAKDCPGGGSRKEEKNNLLVYLGNWQLSNGEEVRLGITRHAYKHMDTLGIKCYDTMEFVDWVKKNLETANIFGRDYSKGLKFWDFLSKTKEFTSPMGQILFKAFQPVPVVPPNVDAGSVVKYKMLFNCYFSNTYPLFIFIKGFD